jgi:hypothetical protein
MFIWQKIQGLNVARKITYNSEKGGGSCLFGLSIYSHISLNEIQHFVTHFSWIIGYPHSAGSFITCIEHRYPVLLFKACFYFLDQYTRKCINFTHLSHKPIKLCVIYSKWKTKISGINNRGHVITMKRKWGLIFHHTNPVNIENITPTPTNLSQQSIILV